MKIPIALSLFSLVVTAIGQSQTGPPFSVTVDWSRQSLETARDELKAAREQIAEEQKPQLKALSSIQSDLAVLRREHTQMAFETDSIKHNIEKLSDQVQDHASQQQNMQHRLLHIRRKFEENLHTIERPNYRETFLTLEQIETETLTDRLKQLEALFAIADTVIDRIDSQIGGHRYPASALASDVMVHGMALQFGPYAFFSPQDGSPGLIAEGDDLMARLRQHTPETSLAIADSLAGSEAYLPFDPLLDQAYLNSDAQVSLWNHLRSGGIWIIPITIFGFLSTIMAILKVIQIRAIRVPERAQIVSLVDTADEAEFNRQLEAITPHARPIFSEGFAYRNAPESARTAAMSQVLLSFRNRIDSGLSLLGLTAAVAPLLGLLGTVTGMIKTFQVISLHGAGDARALSGGISEALVTTELGLVVAIPALLAHAWLNRRARRITIQTAALAERFNKTLPGDGETS